MRQGGQQIARRGIGHDAARSAKLQAGRAELPIPFPIERLAIDDSIQVRVGGVDPETVEGYATIMYEHGGWGPFPPVVAFRDGETHYLSAGFQRCAAARRASEMLVAEGQSPIDEIPVHIRPGGYAAAVEFAEEDNLQHGKPLSNKDKYNMLERRMERGHPWANMSDRAIARHLGVSRTTIANWKREIRKEAVTRGKNLPPEPEMRLGTDGKEYDVGGIQNKNRQRAQQAGPFRREELPPKHEPKPSPPPREEQGNIDEDEPAGRWVDHPVSDPFEPDLTDVQLQQEVHSLLLRVADGLQRLGEVEDSERIADYAQDLYQVWGLDNV